MTTLFDQIDSLASLGPPAAPRQAFTPRPYQTDAANAIRESLAECNSTLVVMPTGCGKTVVFGHVAQEYVKLGKRVLILAHRLELIDQAAHKVGAIVRAPVCVEMAERWAKRNTPSPVVVSSIQTQVRGRYRGFNPTDFGLIVIDEAHHATAKTYRDVLRWYQANPNVKILGVTATPDRADESALGQIFESVAYDYEITDAIRDGWLVPIVQRAVTVGGLDYSNVRTSKGDLSAGDLERVLIEEKTLHGFATPTMKIADGRKTLVFVPTVLTAERLAEIFNRHRPDCARFVCGKTPKEERREMFRDYASGGFQILVNVGVATEGFDDPSIKVVAIARPTKSRCLYAQMAGRGTRTLPGVVDGVTPDLARREAIAESGKPHLEIIDFVGNSGRHKLVTSADILGGKYDDEVVEHARREAEKKADNGGADMLAELDAAQEYAKRRRAEAAKRREVKLAAMYSERIIDPFNVFDIAPQRERAWHKGRPLSEKQRAMLERNRIDPDALTYTDAQRVIGKIINHPELMPCTDKQAHLLQRFGHEPTEINKQQAGEIIDKLAANNWRRA